MKSLRRQWDNLFNKIHLNQVDIFYEICGYWLERSEFKANSKTMVTHFQLLEFTLYYVLFCRGIPERVYPFSKGICSNLHSFCCAQSSVYSMEPLPTPQEVEAKLRPYTCLDLVTGRCC